MTFDSKLIDFDNLRCESEPVPNSNIKEVPMRLKSTSHLTHLFDKPECKLCCKKINDVALYDINHVCAFCDLVCAKLYSDNFEHIEIDSEAYREAHVKGLLSSSAEQLYNKFKNKLFIQMFILRFSKDKTELEQWKTKDIKQYQKYIQRYKHVYIK